MRFDLTDLRLFLCIVDAESITHGADRAGLALPSASARIRGMETASGLRLLDRNPRGVRPTSAGAALARHARLVLGQMEKMKDELRLHTTELRGEIKIHSVTAALARLPDALAQFLAFHPGIDIGLEEKRSQEVVAGVASGAADLGFTADTTPTGSLETRPFTSDRLVLLVPQHHPLARQTSVAFRDTLDEAFIGYRPGTALQALLAAHAAREGRSLRLRVRMDSMVATCSMVRLGAGVAIVSEAAVNKLVTDTRINLVELTDAWTRRNLLICARQFANLPTHVQQLCETLIATIDDGQSTTS